MDTTVSVKSLAQNAQEVKALAFGATAIKEDLAQGLLPMGSLVHGFKITSVIRAGQSNNVYIATSPTGLEVAVKEFFPRRLCKRLPSGRIGVQNEKGKSQFEAGIKGFITEAVALAEIRSDLLAQYVAAFRENGTAYLITAMEPGETLEVYARRVIKARVPGKEYPPEGDLRVIFWMLLNAVQVMHDTSFLHLDIKPSNVIMRDEFTPVLIDLGGARNFPVAPNAAAPAVSNYTPGFAGPEQHLEKSAELCPATDLYGIGASILYCMTGKIPPLASDRLNEDKLNDLLQRCEGRYSSQMIDIVRKCMALRIEDRFSSVQQAQNIIASR